MDLYKNSYVPITSINTSTNVITISNNINIVAFENRRTPFDFLANPPTDTIDSYLYDFKWIIFGAVYRVVFYSANSLSGNIEKDVVYYLRATGSYTCKVYPTKNDAFNQTNAINLTDSLANNDRIYFLFANNYYINPCKDFAAPHQCCPVLPEINTQDVFTGCAVTFNGRQINCHLDRHGGFISAGFYHLGATNENSVLFYGKITDYVNNLGHTVNLICYVQITKIDLETRIRIEIQIPYYSVSGVFYSDTYSVFTKANTTHASFTANGTVTGDSFQGSTSADYNFNHTGNISQTARIKLISASFGSGTTATIAPWYIKPTLLTKFGIGDIDEILTFNSETRCYESELKNYYNIPGRLTVPLTTFYPPNDGFKFVLGNFKLYAGYDANYYYGMPQIYGADNLIVVYPNWDNFQQQKIINSVSEHDFYAHGEIIPLPSYLIGIRAITVQYSRSKNAKTSALTYSSDIEAFYKSNDFFIGSSEVGSFFSTYELT